MTDVRAITVKQPWAWAIAHGGKTIENRSRGTKFRGLILIHAGASWSDRGGRDDRVLDAWWGAGPRPRHASLEAAHYRTRAVIAVAELVDSHPDAACCRPWGESQYSEASGRTRTDVHHLVLANVLALPDPVPATGALGLWRPTPDLLDAVNRKVLPS